MKRLLLPAILSLSLILCIIGVVLTREPSTPSAPQPPASENHGGGIEEGLLKTAQRLTTLASTGEELELAREAVRLADHEIDLAFSSALRATATQAKQSNPELKALADRVARIKARIEAGRERIAKLTKQAASSDQASDELDLAKAQAALDQDELEDAQQDLARQGGDKHGGLERLMQQHEAALHKTNQAANAAAHFNPATLFAQVQLWSTLRNHREQLLQAKKEADDHVTDLGKQHQSIESSIHGQTSGTVAGLTYLSGQTKTLTEFDKRIQDSAGIAKVYQRWHALVEARQHAVVHGMLISLAWIVGIFCTIVATDRVIRHSFRTEADRRRRHHLRIIAIVATQVVGALVILFIVFGPPSQLSTIIGLATAGLTVVLKDFIVAFFGWFALMGKNGIHVGDWVEIEGVGGEVIEIGLLRTVLLEVGNWTDRGHPTGRHVSFMNSFALEHHFFNFSTSDQWLWDELVVALPAGIDPYQMAQRILEKVQEETRTDAQLAEQDWQRVTRDYAAKQFSAKPATDIRPSSTGLGLDVRVRYITRAPRRYEVKSRLFEAVVEILHQAAQAVVTN